MWEETRTGASRKSVRQNASQHSERSGTYRHCRHESLGHVGHDHTDRKDDGVNNPVANDQAQDEEQHPHANSQVRNELHELLDLDGDRGLRVVRLGREACDLTHDGPIPRANHNPPASSRVDNCGVEAQVGGLKWLRDKVPGSVPGKCWRAFDRLGFASKGRVVHLQQKKRRVSI
jgi:hypothetical protein